MKPTANTLLLATASILPGLCLPAQEFRPVPGHADLVDGHVSHFLPFGIPGFRTQFVVDAAHVGANGAVLSGLSFRGDRTFAGLATPVPNVTVRLSQTTVAVGSLSTAFANNITGPTTVVFQGTVTLPQPAPGFAGPLPWDIVIPFAQPYSFSTAQGNLLIDIVANNLPHQHPTYYLDAVQPGGSATMFGTHGQAPIFNKLIPSGNSLVPRLTSPGHTISFTAMQFSTTLGAIALGMAAQPAPIDLGPIGAPMNFVYIDPVVFVPFMWAPSFLGFASTCDVAVPNSPLFVGTTIYAQSVTLEPIANPLGLVLSHGIEVRIGDQFEVLPLQQLDAQDPSSATGQLLDFGGQQPEYGAVPVRFAGVFF